MTFAESLSGTTAPQDIIDNLTLLDVDYVDFAGASQMGQLLIATDLADEVRSIFAALKQSGFPIEKIIPIVSYDWDDRRSIADNNSSAFNYRLIAGTDKLSNHAHGRAIDINPHQNPYIGRDGKVQPAGAQYNPKIVGTITADGVVVKIFKKYGWEWGGDWGESRGYFDYHHFQKEK